VSMSSKFHLHFHTGTLIVYLLSLLVFTFFQFCLHCNFLLFKSLSQLGFKVSSALTLVDLPLVSTNHVSTHQL